MRHILRLLSLAVLAVACARQAQPVPSADGANSPAAGELAGTKWVLVKFTGLSNADVIVPPAVSNYTIAFGTDGRVAVQADCDRATGNWSSTEGSTLRVSQLAITPGTCQTGSIPDRFVRDLQKLNTWTKTNGHLYISLRAKAGTYEFEPAN